MPPPSPNVRRWARADHPPWLHGEVARRMGERLPVIRHEPGTVAQWWAWSGAGDAVLAAAYPKAAFLRVEPDAALLARGAPRRRWFGPRTARCLEGAVPSESCGLVWANMMLHAVADPRAVIARWHAALEVDGFLMFSCLGPDSLKALRPPFARRGWGTPARDFIDMHDLGDLLVHAGFADPVMDQEALTLTYGDADALLAELHALGGNAAPDRFAGLRTPRWRGRLRAELEDALRGSDGRLRLGFEIVYGHAFRPAARARAAGETRVSLDAMRDMVRTSRRP